MLFDYVKDKSSTTEDRPPRAIVLAGFADPRLHSWPVNHLLAQNEGYRGTNIDNDFGRLIPNNASTLEAPIDEDNFVGEVTGGLFIVRMHALRIRVQPSQCGR